MTMTGTRALDRAVHKTNEWLSELDESFGWDDSQKTFLAMQAVLRTLRDRLQVNEAVQLGAQLPMVIRGAYYNGWQPSKTPRKLRTPDDFLEAVSSAYGGTDPIAPGEMVEGVFWLLANHVSAGEIDDVKSGLPAFLDEYWPD